MSPGLTDEQRQALRSHPGKPIEIEDQETKNVYFIVDQALLERAMQALQQEQDHAAIREGIEQMEAGLGQPLDEVDAEIREEMGFPPRA